MTVIHLILCQWLQVLVFQWYLYILLPVPPTVLINYYISSHGTTYWNYMRRMMLKTILHCFPFIYPRGNHWAEYGIADQCKIVSGLKISLDHCHLLSELFVSSFGNAVGKLWCIYKLWRSAPMFGRFSSASVFILLHRSSLFPL